MECRTVGTLLQPWKLDLSEFESLASMAQRSRIIGVGEGAHFVSEFSLARASLIRYFIERHGYHSIGLECGAIQGRWISQWLNSKTDTDDLKSTVNPLTFALYGSVLTWLKSYLRQLLPLWTGRAVNFVTSGSGWPFFHSPRGKSGMSHGLNR
jgi:erythromycin esterase